MGPPAKITRREGRTGPLLLTSSGLGYPRRRGCSPPPPQLRTHSLSPLTFTSAERGVAEVRSEPADQPGCPKEQPGHSAGSQDAGARRPRRALGASCGHGRNLSTPSMRSPSRVTGTERRKHFHPGSREASPLAPPLVIPAGAGRGAAQAQAERSLLPWERSSGRPGGPLDRGSCLRTALPALSPASCPQPDECGLGPCL